MRTIYQVAALILLAACAGEAEIVSVCECDLTVDWEGTRYEVNRVGVVSTTLSALEAQEFLREARIEQDDIVSMESYWPEDGGSEVTVDAVATTAIINLWDEGIVVARAIAEPTADEITSEVFF